MLAWLVSVFISLSELFLGVCSSDGQFMSDETRLIHQSNCRYRGYYYYFSATVVLPFLFRINRIWCGVWERTSGKTFFGKQLEDCDYIYCRRISWPNNSRIDISNEGESNEARNNTNQQVCDYRSVLGRGLVIFIFGLRLSCDFGGYFLNINHWWSGQVLNAKKAEYFLNCFPNIHSLTLE